MLLTLKVSYFVCDLDAHICGRYCISLYALKLGVCVHEL